MAGALLPATTAGFISPITFSILIIGGLATACWAVHVLPAGAGRRHLHRRRTVPGHALEQRPARGAAPPGIADAVPFLVIILVLVVRGRGLRCAAASPTGCPGSAPAGSGPLVVLVLVALAVVCCCRSLLHDALHQHPRYVATIISVTFAIVGLSVVVLTGYTGQLSLAQFALAGIGAFRRRPAGRRSRVAVRAGPAGRGAGGHGDRLPVRPAGAAHPRGQPRGGHLRPRFAVFQLVFSNSSYTENARVQPTDIRLPRLPVDPSATRATTPFLCLGFLCWPLSRSPTCAAGRIGRRLLAVRTNERAAAAIGVNVFEAKLYAFTLSAGIAGLGGVWSASATAILYQSVFQPGPRSACWC